MTSSAPHTDTTIQIKSRTALLGEVRIFVTRAARAFGFLMEDVSKIELAVDEAITNIIKHAYKYDPEGLIRVEITTQEAADGRIRFIVSISDNGVSFDRASYTPPDMREYFQKLRRGGLGLVLMNKLMDEVEYDIRPGVPNKLRLVKYLPNARPRT